MEDLRVERLPLDLSPLRGVQVVAIENDRAKPTAADLCLDVAAREPSAPIIVLAETFDDADAFSVLRLGVKGLVTFDELRERLPRILREVGAGGFWVSRGLLSRFFDSARQEAEGQRRLAREVALTPRESEVLEDLLRNLSNKEIAKRRQLTSRTVKFHVSNVLAKYGVKRRADLLLLSYSPH